MNDFSLQLNIWSAIFGYGALQGLFLAVLIRFHRAGQPAVNRQLGLLMAVLSLLLTQQFAWHSGLVFSWPHLANLTISLWFLIGPLIYFYLLILAGKPLPARWAMGLHLLPAAIHLMNLLPFYVLPSDQKLAILTGAISLEKSLYTEVFTNLATYGYMTQIIWYAFLSRRITKGLEKSLRARNSGAVVEQMVWFRCLINILLTYVCFEAVGTILLLITTGKINPLVVNCSIAILSSIIFAVAIYAIRYPELLFHSNVDAVPVNNHLPPQEGSERREETEKFPVLPLPPDILLSRVQRLMEVEKLFLKNDLNLPELSRLAELTTHQLSWLLNAFAGTNFYDFVNHYRIQASRRMLLDPAYNDLTISAIALEAGFNSAASFYRAFKRSTGLTPAAYIKKQSNPRPSVEIA